MVQPKLLLNLLIMDHTKVTAVTLFTEQAERVLRLDMSRVQDRKHRQELHRAVRSAVGRRFDFLVRPRFHYYNERIALKSLCSGVSRTSFRQIGWQLVRSLQASRDPGKQRPAEASPSSACSSTAAR